MCAFWLVTSALLANLYREFCDDLEEPSECGDTDRRFIATPVLGFVCLAGWVRNRLYSLCTITYHGYSTGNTKRQVPRGLWMSLMSTKRTDLCSLFLRLYIRGNTYI